MIFHRRYEKRSLHYDRKAAATARKEQKKKKSGLKKPLGHANEMETEEPIEIFEQKLEKLEATRLVKQSRREKRKRALMRGIQILLAIMSAYLAFLIYGLFVTEYEYNEQGGVVPKIVSVEEIESKSVYGELYKYYCMSRSLYEDVLRIDYKLSLDPESKLVATEYEELLDEVTSLTVAIDAFEPGSKYSQMKNMILEWVRTDIAVYLQNVSAAILQNNQEKAANAVSGREQVYSDFMIISENLAALGEAVPGYDLSDLYEWSPEKYISEVLEGVKMDE